jgi:hypothetical protein
MRIPVTFSGVAPPVLALVATFMLRSVELPLTERHGSGRNLPLEIDGVCQESSAGSDFFFAPNTTSMRTISWLCTLMRCGARILVTPSVKQLALLSLVPCERENARRPYTLVRARHIGYTHNNSYSASSNHYNFKKKIRLLE